MSTEVAAPTDVQETPDVSEDTAVPDEGPAEELPSPQDDGPPPPDTDETCTCIPTDHCDENGACVDDVCTQGATTCASLEQISICNEDGSAFELIDCDENTACYLGECVAQKCDPGGPAVCEDGQIKVCNGLGTEYNLIPCPGGTACKDGECVPIEPNVILLVDTSGSMNWVNEAGGMPDECEGDDCVPWTWPMCDDPESPVTRLGKAKKALQGVLTSDAAADARMALMRFPQLLNILGGGAAPTCAGAGLKGFGKIFQEQHALEYEQVQPEKLGSIMPVPFPATQQTDKSSLLEWIDFSQVYDIGDKDCILATVCDGEPGNKWCVGNKCAALVEPELFATGQTPIGRTLFYAGEYLRHAVVAQGRDCAADADCASPHYTCLEGKCHDPYRACRPNVIVLLSDGAESFDTFAEKFFHPFIQAKRLHYGLGCSSDADCLSGATCVGGACTAPDELPDAVCHLTDVPCTKNQEGFEYKYKCGPAQTCSGKCDQTGLTWTDSDEGAEVLRDAAGDPIAVTIHVVDASSALVGSKTIATLGGGKHLPVDLDDPQSIIDVFLPLLDVKAAVEGCGP